MLIYTGSVERRMTQKTFFPTGLEFGHLFFKSLGMKQVGNVHRSEFTRILMGASRPEFNNVDNNGVHNECNLAPFCFARRFPLVPTSRTCRRA